MDTKDIRERLANNTAIDAKEIQELCDMVDDLLKIIEIIKNRLGVEHGT